MQRPMTTRLRAIMSAGLLFFASPVFAAETLQTSDYIAVSFEIEDYTYTESRWVVTNATTPAQAIDPDGNHSDGASGGVYLEVLPDYRVTDEDEFHPSGSLWDAGQGPELKYSVNFPEAGRYYVHMRAFSTGSEDNGAHISLAGAWSQDGARIQWCRGKHQWTWSSAQRDSGGAGSCGLEKTIFVDVPAAGLHEINITAREDGVELDRVTMIKDLSGNTRVCEPVGMTQISCSEGFIESTDDLVDLQVEIISDASEVLVGETALLNLAIENLDAFDHAYNVKVAVDLDDGMSYVSGSSDCIHNAGVVTCTHSDLEPTAPMEPEEFAITVRIDEAGVLNATASISSDQDEEFTANDSAEVSLTGVANLVDVDLSLALSASSVAVNLSDSTSIMITVKNPAATHANDVVVSYNADPGSVVGLLPNECAPGQPVTCQLGVIQPTSEMELVIPIVLSVAGTQIHSATVVSQNELDAANNTASIEMEVTDPNAASEGSETTSGTTTSGSTDGGVTGATETTGGSATSGTDESDAQTTSGGTTAGETNGGGNTGVTGGTAQANAGSGGGALGFIWLAMLILAPFIRIWNIRRR